MGICGSSSNVEVPPSSGGDKHNPPANANNPPAAAYKCLLLGSGESGKSTIFKRILLTYGRGFKEDDRMDYVEAIYENTIESMKTLIYQAGTFEEKEDCQIAPDKLDASKRVMQLQDDAKITPDVAKDIKTLWADDGIKRTFGYRALFQVPDSASYFFERVDALAQAGYVPTEEDVLRCRDRTTGAHGENIDIAQTTFEVVDVGGQRSERKAWVKVFQNVKALLFVVALSEFDQLCFEDEETNRLDEALKVFAMLVNSKVFKDVPIMLIFNKMDLFELKMETDAVFDFENYDGPQHDAEAICNFVAQKFKDQSATPRDILTKFICAIKGDLDLTDIFKEVRNYYEK